MRFLSLALIFSFACCGDPSLETPAQDQPAITTDPTPITHECLEFGDGNRPGDRIADASFTNCLGETVNLHDTCGQYPLKVLAVSTVWCPACKSYLRGLTYDHQISRGGWDYLILVAEDVSHSSDISLEECMAYAEELDADPAKMVLDPGFRQSWQGSLIDMCVSNGSLSLPFMAILDGWDNKYEYSKSCRGSAENGYTNWRDAFLGEIYEDG